MRRLVPTEIDAIARAALGEPQNSSPEKLRYQGFEVSLATGLWYDFAREERVDTVAAIARIKGLSSDGAQSWIADRVAGPLTNGHDEQLDLADVELAPRELPEELAEERELLGMIILHNGLLAEVEETIGATAFISRVHQRIFSVFDDAREEGYVANISAVLGALSGEFVGEVAPGYQLAPYIAHLAASVPTIDGGEEGQRRHARELARIIQEREDVETGYTEPDYAPQPPAKPPRFVLVPFGQVRMVARPRYLVRGIIPSQGLVVVWGPPKCGKSFWLSDLCFHVALGWTYRGRAVEQGAVVYFVLEGETGFADRIEAFRLRFMTKAPDPKFYMVPTRLDLVGDAKQMIDDIRAQNVAPALIAIDTVNRSLRGSESSDQDMGNYVKAADLLREAFGCVVALVHHSGIEATRPRGHTSLTGAADAQIAVRRDASRNIITKIEYMKDGGHEGDEIASKLEVVEVGKEPGGRAVTSCVVVALEQAGDAKADPDGFRFHNDGDRIFYGAVVDALANSGIIPPPDVKAPRHAMVIHRDMLRDALGRRVAFDEPDPVKRASRIRKTIQRGLDKLTGPNFRLLGVDWPFIWRTTRKVQGFDLPPHAFQASNERQGADLSGPGDDVDELPL